MPFPLIPIIGLISGILDKVIPDKGAAEKAKQELSLLLANQEFQTQLAQINTNLEEAKSPNWWVAGWRPCVGWVCALTFAYTYLILPLLNYAVYTFGTAEMIGNVAKLPPLDLDMMLPILLGMLGLGGMRSYEKARNSSGNH